MKKLILFLLVLSLAEATSSAKAGVFSRKKTAKRSGEVNCAAGILSCGERYMHCWDPAQEVDDSMLLEYWDLLDEEICG